jgi:hypothetical protein
MTQKKCSNCKHHFLSVRKFDKCSKSKTELGHAVIYTDCISERKKEYGCGENAVWFEHE